MSSYVRTYVRTYVGYSKVVPSLMHPIKQLHTSVHCAPVQTVREERGQVHVHWNSVLSLLEFTHAAISDLLAPMNSESDWSDYPMYVFSMAYISGGMTV